MLVRSAMHQAGAAALTRLLQFPAPAADQRSVACSCGHSAHYRELRCKPILTVVGVCSGRTRRNCPCSDSKPAQECIMVSPASWYAAAQARAFWQEISAAVWACMLHSALQSFEPLDEAR
jgi:hypothetical protein